MTETNISTARVPQVTVIDPRIPEKAKLRVAAYARVSSDSVTFFMFQRAINPMLKVLHYIWTESSCLQRKRLVPKYLPDRT